MATITWTGAAGDNNFSNPANWSPMQVPGAGDSAVITPAAATAIGVGGITVGALTDSATVTLTVGDNSSFALGAGGGNSSTSFSNGGTLALASTGDTTNFILNDTATTLTGGGTVLLSDDGSNRIYGATGSDTLTNVNNLIEGAGQFGVNQLTFVNDSGGTVDATSASNALVLQMVAPITNDGLLEGTGAAGLVITNTDVVQTGGGTISAGGKAGVVVLNGSTVHGGTLETSGGGLIEVGGNGAGLDGTVQQVVNKGTLVVQNGTTLYLAGTIDNTGTISEAAGANSTAIRLSSAFVTLTGGGQLTLSNSGNNYIYGNSGAFQLTNVNNTISGAGQLGDGQMVLVNDAKGVIDANQATALVLNTGNIVTNAGVMEDTGTGGLVITNVYSVLNTGGTISAVGAGAHVDLNNTTIQGGTVTSSKGGLVQDTGSAALDGGSAGGSLTLGGTFSVNNGTTLYLGGTIANTGMLQENAGVNGTAIRLSSPTMTLTGGGQLVLSNSDANYIYGNSFTDVLVNVNNVISGTGQLGDGQMTLVNEAGGTIDATNAAIANLSSGVLNINCNGGITNAGLIEDTGSAGLSIVNSTVYNAGGTITATGASSGLTINGSNIEGGLVSGEKGGTVYLVNSASLDGSESGIGAITLAGAVQVVNGQTAYLNGVIDNTGTLTVDSTGSGTVLRLGDQLVTLTGGGTLALSANGNNYLYGNSSLFVLDNVNNTISGAGQLGNGQMTLVNAAGGTIDGNTTAGLMLNCNGGVTNLGVIEATAAGGLTVLNSLVNNAGGTITANGSASSVTINNSNIEAGTLSGVNGGVVYLVNNASLDGSEPGLGAITTAGNLQVVNGQTAYLNGAISNTGTITIDSVGNGTALRLGTQLVTLTGGGTLAMSDNANNYLYGNQGYFVLDNVNNTISGAGQLGDGQMALTNTGTIDANGTVALVLNTGAYNVINGAGGVIEATATGGLAFSSGIFSNAGTVAAAGGNLTFGGGVDNLNSASGTLTGGTWSASGGGTLSIDGGAVSVDAATIVLAGAGSTFQAGNGSSFTGLGTSLTAIAAGGDLTLGAMAALSVTASSLADSGAVTLAGGTLTVKSLAIGASGSLSGFGSDKGSVIDSGTITAAGGTLAISGNVSGKGSVQIDNNSVASLGGKDTVASIVFASGGTETLALAKPAGATSVISGFASGDVIDLTKTAATSLNYSGNTTNGVLTVKNGSTTVATFKFSGDYTTASFALAPQGSGVIITETGSTSMHFLQAPHAVANEAVPAIAALLPASVADFGHATVPHATGATLPWEASHFGALFAEAHIAADPMMSVVPVLHGGW